MTQLHVSVVMSSSASSPSSSSSEPPSFDMEEHDPIAPTIIDDVARQQQEHEDDDDDNNNNNDGQEPQSLYEVLQANKKEQSPTSSQQQQQHQQQESSQSKKSNKASNAKKGADSLTAFLSSIPDYYAGELPEGFVDGKDMPQQTDNNNTNKDEGEQKDDNLYDAYSYEQLKRKLVKVNRLLKDLSDDGTDNACYRKHYDALNKKRVQYICSLKQTDKWKKKHPEAAPTTTTTTGATTPAEGKSSSSSSKPQQKQEVTVDASNEEEKEEQVEEEEPSELEDQGEEQKEEEQQPPPPQMEEKQVQEEKMETSPNDDDVVKKSFTSEGIKSSPSKSIRDDSTRISGIFDMVMNSHNKNVGGAGTSTCSKSTEDGGEMQCKYSYGVLQKKLTKVNRLIDDLEAKRGKDDSEQREMNYVTLYEKLINKRKQYMDMVRGTKEWKEQNSYDEGKSTTIEKQQDEETPIETTTTDVQTAVIVQQEKEVQVTDTGNENKDETNNNNEEFRLLSSITGKDDDKDCTITNTRISGIIDISLHNVRSFDGGKTKDKFSGQKQKEQQQQQYSYDMLVKKLAKVDRIINDVESKKMQGDYVVGYDQIYDKLLIKREQYTFALQQTKEWQEKNPSSSQQMVASTEENDQTQEEDQQQTSTSKDSATGDSSKRFLSPIPEDKKYSSQTLPPTLGGGIDISMHNLDIRINNLGYTNTKDNNTTDQQQQQQQQDQPQQQYSHEVLSKKLAKVNRLLTDLSWKEHHDEAYNKNLHDKLLRKQEQYKALLLECERKQEEEEQQQQGKNEQEEQEQPTTIDDTIENQSPLPVQQEEKEQEDESIDLFDEGEHNNDNESDYHTANSSMSNDDNNNHASGDIRISEIFEISLHNVHDNAATRNGEEQPQQEYSYEVLLKKLSKVNRLLNDQSTKNKKSFFDKLLIKRDQYTESLHKTKEWQELHQNPSENSPQVEVDERKSPTEEQPQEENEEQHGVQQTEELQGDDDDDDDDDEEEDLDEVGDDELHGFLLSFREENNTSTSSFGVVDISHHNLDYYEPDKYSADLLSKKLSKVNRLLNELEIQAQCNEEEEEAFDQTEYERLLMKREKYSNLLEQAKQKEENGVDGQSFHEDGAAPATTADTATASAFKGIDVSDHKANAGGSKRSSVQQREQYSYDMLLKKLAKVNRLLTEQEQDDQKFNSKYYDKLLIKREQYTNEISHTREWQEEHCPRSTEIYEDEQAMSDETEDDNDQKSDDDDHQHVAFATATTCIDENKDKPDADIQQGYSYELLLKKLAKVNRLLDEQEHSEETFNSKYYDKLLIKREQYTESICQTKEWKEEHSNPESGQEEEEEGKEVKIVEEQTHVQDEQEQTVGDTETPAVDIPTTGPRISGIDFNTGKNSGSSGKREEYPYDLLVRKLAKVSRLLTEQERDEEKFNSKFYDKLLKKREQYSNEISHTREWQEEHGGSQPQQEHIDDNTGGDKIATTAVSTSACIDISMHNVDGKDPRISIIGQQQYSYDILVKKLEKVDRLLTEQDNDPGKFDGNFYGKLLKKREQYTTQLIDTKEWHEGARPAFFDDANAIDISGHSRANDVGTTSSSNGSSGEPKYSYEILMRKLTKVTLLLNEQERNKEKINKKYYNKLLIKRDQYTSALSQMPEWQKGLFRQSAPSEKQKIVEQREEPQQTDDDDSGSQGSFYDDDGGDDAPVDTRDEDVRISMAIQPPTGVDNIKDSHHQYSHEVLEKKLNKVNRLLRDLEDQEEQGEEGFNRELYAKLLLKRDQYTQSLSQMSESQRQTGDSHETDDDDSAFQASFHGDDDELKFRSMERKNYGEEQHREVISTRDDDIRISLAIQPSSMGGNVPTAVVKSIDLKHQKGSHQEYSYDMLQKKLNKVNRMLSDLEDPGKLDKEGFNRNLYEKLLAKREQYTASMSESKACQVGEEDAMVEEEDHNIVNGFMLWNPDGGHPNESAANTNSDIDISLHNLDGGSSDKHEYPYTILQRKLNKVNRLLNDVKEKIYEGGFDKAYYEKLLRKRAQYTASLERTEEC